MAPSKANPKKKGGKNRPPAKKTTTKSGGLPPDLQDQFDRMKADTCSRLEDYTPEDFDALFERVWKPDYPLAEALKALGGRKSREANELALSALAMDANHAVAQVPEKVPVVVRFRSIRTGHRRDNPRETYRHATVLAQAFLESGDEVLLHAEGYDAGAEALFSAPLNEPCFLGLRLTDSEGPVVRARANDLTAVHKKRKGEKPPEFTDVRSFLTDTFGVTEIADLPDYPSDKKDHSDVRVVEGMVQGVYTNDAKGYSQMTVRDRSINPADTQERPLRFFIDETTAATVGKYSTVLVVARVENGEYGVEVANLLGVVVLHAVAPPKDERRAKAKAGKKAPGIGSDDDDLDDFDDDEDSDEEDDEEDEDDDEDSDDFDDDDEDEDEDDEDDDE